MVSWTSNLDWVVAVQQFRVASAFPLSQRMVHHRLLLRHDNASAGYFSCPSSKADLSKVNFHASFYCPSLGEGRPRRSNKATLPQGIGAAGEGRHSSVFYLPGCALFK